MLIVYTDDSAFQESLTTIYRRLGDLTPVMQSIGLELESRISGRFESRSDPAGRAWAPWADSTVATYPDDGNRRLLDRYGDMLLSLNHKATSDSVRVGFGKPYSTYHEFGTKHMPRRGLIFEDADGGKLGASDETAVLDILGVWLNALAA